MITKLGYDVRQQCACGCGKTVKPGRNWLKGHCNRGRKRPDASARMKAGGAVKASRAHWGDPRPPYWGAFDHHRYRAKKDGIEFLFTYEEWIGIWRESGHLLRRGTRWGALGYCMARNGDKGPYAVGNVRIITNRENIAERDNSPIAIALLGNKHVEGLVWVTDGVSERRVKPNSIPVGWVVGRHFKRNRRRFCAPMLTK